MVDMAICECERHLTAALMLKSKGWGGGRQRCGAALRGMCSDSALRGMLLLAGIGHTCAHGVHGARHGIPTYPRVCRPTLNH